MKLTLSGLLLFVLHGLTTCRDGVKVHSYVSTPMTCSFAQKYCQEFHKDLSIVSNNEDLLKLKDAAGGKYSNSWINSLENSCKSLKYEDTETTAVKFLLDRLPFCTITYGARWKTPSCSDKIPFFCYENVSLVQEKKTWDEALQHCRSHYTDLASFRFDWPQNQIKHETQNAHTDSVWTGLRFLGGNWYWLYGKDVEKDLSLPSCPADPYQCGARNTRTEQWENRDCEEKLNFLCVHK